MNKSPHADDNDWQALVVVLLLLLNPRGNDELLRYGRMARGITTELGIYLASLCYLYCVVYWPQPALTVKSLTASKKNGERAIECRRNTFAIGGLPVV